MVALAILFSGLLMSTAVLPTLFSCKSQSSASVTPLPTEEEEHSHGGRDMAKEVFSTRTWCCTTWLLDQRLRAAFRHHEESLPSHPLRAVPDRPPREVC